MNTANIINGVALTFRDEAAEHAENIMVHLTEEKHIEWNANNNRKYACIGRMWSI